MCKEWVLKNNYVLLSATYPKGKFSSSYCSVKELSQSNSEFITKLNGDTETEAIFKASEWILNENKRNK